MTLLDISNNKLTLGDYHGKFRGGRDNDSNYATDMTGMCSPLEVCLLIRSAIAGVTTLADAILGMGAILSVNLLKNKIGVDQAKALASILKEHPTLKSLCGNSGEETELDMSGKGMEAEDAIMLAPEIVDNGALSVLNLASNNLGEIVLAAGWRSKYNDDRAPWVGPEGQEQDEKPEGQGSQGIIAIANTISIIARIDKTYDYNYWYCYDYPHRR